MRVRESSGPDIKNGLPSRPNVNVSAAIGMSPKIASASVKPSLGAKPKEARVGGCVVQQFARNRRIDLDVRLLPSRRLHPLVEFLPRHHSEERVLDAKAPDIDEEKAGGRQSPIRCASSCIPAPIG